MNIESFCGVESIFIFSPHSGAAWEAPCLNPGVPVRLWFVLSKIRLTWQKRAVDPERTRRFMFIGHWKPCGHWLLIKWFVPSLWSFKSGRWKTDCKLAHGLQQLPRTFSWTHLTFTPRWPQTLSSVRAEIFCLFNFTHIVIHVYISDGQ